MVQNDFTNVLLRWFDENRRDLPWRQTRDPYAIWLSEVILQQTRIQQGWAYWERFMKRFPTVEDWAIIVVHATCIRRPVKLLPKGVSPIRWKAFGN